MKGLVSVIVPIYNTQSYLRECLDSLRVQTWHELEILLIDDGSTDTSAEICREYCAADTRFRLFQQENQGLPMARNCGLDHARGEWLCFVDSDDRVNERYVELLLRNLEESGADLSLCGYVRFDGGLPLTEMGENRWELLNRLQILARISTSGPGNQSEAMVVSWNKLMRTEQFGGLRFEDHLHEDEFMINAYLERTRLVVWTDEPLYYYRQRPTGIMGQRKNLRHLEALEAIHRRIELFSGSDFEPVFDRILASYFENAIIQFFQLKDKGNRHELKKRIYPLYARTLWRWRGRLGWLKALQFGLFLLSPTLYRRRYWS